MFMGILGAVIIALVIFILLGLADYLVRQFVADAFLLKVSRIVIVVFAVLTLLWLLLALAGMAPVPFPVAHTRY